MNWENLQNRLKQDSSQNEDSVNVDEIWAAIEPEVDVLNKEKRKRRFFFFWLFGIGLAIALGSLYFVFNENDISNSIVTNDLLEEKIVKEKEIKSNTVIEKNIKEATTLNESQSEIENTSINVNEINSSKIPSIQSKNNSNQTLNKNIETKNKLAWITQPNQKSIAANNSSSDLVFLQSADNEIVSSIENASLNLQESNDNSIFSTSSNAKFISLLQKIESLDGNQILFPSIENEIELPDNILQYYLPMTKEEIENILGEKEDPPRRKPKFSYSVGLFGALGNAPKTLEAKNDSIGNELLLIRRNSESSLETSQFGLSFSLRHENGFHLTTGLQRTSFVEKTSFDDSLVEVEDIPGIVALRIDLNGDTIPVEGMIPRTTTTTLEKKFFNRYNLFEVPLIVGYQTGYKNKNPWSFGVEAGVVSNISLKTKGFIFDENYDDVNIDENQKNIFKSNIGLSYHLGFSVRRKIGDNFEASFTPAVRFFPKDFSVADYSISQKYNLISAKLGVNYIFGK